MGEMCIRDRSNIIAVDYDPGASEVNQLNRIKLMLATAPNEKWTTDVTEFKIPGEKKKLYLSAILDLYDRYPVAVSYTHLYKPMCLTSFIS